MEVPHLEALYKQYKDQGLVVIGINTEFADANVKRFAQSNMSYPVLLNGHGAAQTYGVGGIPDTYYIDKAGIVRYRDLGFSGRRSGIEKKIKKLLAD